MNTLRYFVPTVLAALLLASLPASAQEEGPLPAATEEPGVEPGVEPGTEPSPPVPAAATAATGGTEWDDEEPVGPHSTLSLGVGNVTHDNQRFGEYTGLDQHGSVGLVDIDLNHLGPTTGKWLRVRGRNLGLDSRELRLDHSRQGRWGISLEYNRIPHATPYDINTGLTGIGTDQLTTAAITPGAGARIDLGTDREILRAGLNADLPAGFDVRVSFRNEDKTGERMFGRTGIDFLVEPIDSSTRQIEAVLAFTGDRLQVSGGYYLTAFENKYTGMVVDGVTDGPNNVYSPIGLPPDNQSHQFSLSGGYSLTAATRANFKLAYGTITQDDPFISTVTVAPGVGNNLNGEINTTQAQLGLTSRPTQKLDLGASLRYENRDDKTPVLVYYTGATPTSRSNGENEPRDVKTTAGKAEASYRLPGDLRLTGGVDYEKIERNASDVRSVSARKETNETTYRVEARRSMAAVNGGLALIHSARGGSPFLVNVLNDGSPGSNQIAPVHYADRKRDKLRLTFDAMAGEALSLQFVTDAAWDSYESRTVQSLGPRRGTWQHVALDASLSLSPVWQLTAFASHDRTTTAQNSCNGSPSDGTPCAPVDLWRAELTSRGSAVGVGLRGKPGERLQTGADLQFSLDAGEYFQDGDPLAAPVPAAPMPRLIYKTRTLTMFADYALTTHSGIGLNLTHERRKNSDWSWVGWQYADGTTVYQDPLETITFAGARYFLRWP
ncbi:MAG: MtrB/PioB family decaheme-associated outer membrane protein [Nitrospirota bacterium]|nr:MtrB/PioB family decaheme-associated outer membrane protein [Nitrospirota bacterium]